MAAGCRASLVSGIVIQKHLEAIEAAADSARNAAHAGDVRAPFRIPGRWPPMVEGAKMINAGHELESRIRKWLGVAIVVAPSAPRQARGAERHTRRGSAALRRSPTTHRPSSYRVSAPTRLSCPDVFRSQVELSCRTATTTRNRKGDLGLPTTTSFSPTASGTVAT